ncbi:DUF1365 domain-containing protein [Marinobacter sp.]|uniref:DUF1365 domain-containing protein n=1 Tax=Marinobacter sp. TaxID=50741 RepID=UPI002B265781|nr:DUF1365 domain-containing protein [Marinobacter sp.]
MASEWLEGTIRHRRKLPTQHQFCYDIGMLALDVDDWDSVTSISPFFSLERFNWLGLHREDYLDPDEPNLRRAVDQRVQAATGWLPDGPIQLITHPRYFGHIFNPVSFYLCYEPGLSPGQGDVPKVILAQITNTPWKERHLYCMECQQPGTHISGQWQSEHFAFSKRFHVSPFNGMDQHYQWLFSFRGSELRIHMNVEQERRKHFDATLVVQRTPLNRISLHRSLRRFPIETLKGVAGIYWNALKLKLKGTPFYTHPDKLDENESGYRRGSEDLGLDITEPQTMEQLDTKPKGRVSSWRT